jgi:hypothetical protein
MRGGVLRDLLSELDDEQIDDAAKSIVRRLVHRIAIRDGNSWFEQQERVDFSVRLLDGGVSRITVRDRLMAHYEISQRHAHRVITVALKSRQKQPLNGSGHG